MFEKQKMMNSRNTVAKVQTLTKSEYALAKHIPNAVPLKRLLPESDGISEPLEPTPKMNVQRAPRYHLLISLFFQYLGLLLLKKSI